jgi:hypothetical protein
MANSTDNLRKFFNIGFKNKADNDIDKIFPLKDDPKKIDSPLKKGEIHSKIKDAFPSTVQVLFDWWMSDTHNAMDTWKTMASLFEDCNLMFMNSGIMSRAAELMADEVVQAGSNTQPIIVEAKRKQKKFILDFFDKINLYSHIRPIASSVIKYGNAGLVLSYDTNGIDKVIPQSVFSFRERLEFSPQEVELKIKKKNLFLYDYKNKISRIDQLIKMITNKDNITSYYSKYLFGFVVGDQTLPPWRFLHFRNYDTESPFDPFGVPVFIYSLGPYMQMDAGMTMQVAARAASFPKDVYKLTMPASMPYTEKLSAATEFARELQNSGINAVVKEKDGVGEVYITIEGLYEYEQQTPDMDLGKIGDLEMLRDDLILSTLLPRYILDANDGGYGDTGVSLIEKFKPFARSVYRVQAIILEQISQLVKIQMIYSGEFSLDEIDFVLSMPYPESQTNDEVVRSQNDLLDLSNNVIDALSDKFMDGEPIPNDVKKDIYKKFLPYDDKLIDDWVKEIEKASVDNDGDEIDKKTERIRKDKLNKKWLLVEKSMGGKRRFKENINDIILDTKQFYLREGTIRGYHYYSSKNIDQKFPAEMLREFDKQRIKNVQILNEDEMGVKKKYKFKK